MAVFKIYICFPGIISSKGTSFFNGEREGVIFLSRDAHYFPLPTVENLVKLVNRLILS